MDEFYSLKLMPIEFNALRKSALLKKVQGGIFGISVNQMKSDVV